MSAPSKVSCMHGCANRVHLAYTSNRLLVLSCVIGANNWLRGVAEYWSEGPMTLLAPLPVRECQYSTSPTMKIFFFQNGTIEHRKMAALWLRDSPVWQMELVLWWWWQMSWHLNPDGLNELSVYLLEESRFPKAALCWGCILPQKCTPQCFNYRRGSPCCCQPYPHLSFPALSISVTTQNTAGPPHSVQITMPGWLVCLDSGSPWLSLAWVLFVCLLCVCCSPLLW